MGDRASSRPGIAPISASSSHRSTPEVAQTNATRCVFCEEEIKSSDSVWMTSCRHPVCVTCLDELSNGASKCPLDGTTVNRKNVRMTSVKSDSNQQQQQREVLFRCPNKDKCNQLIPIELIQDHLAKCFQGSQTKQTTPPASPIRAVGPAVQQVKMETAEPSTLAPVVMRPNAHAIRGKARPVSFTAGGDMAMASVNEQRQQIEFLRDFILTIELRVDRVLQVMKEGMNGLQESSSTMKNQLDNKIEAVDTEIKSLKEKINQMTLQMNDVTASLAFPKVEAASATSYDGVIIWKVENYSLLKAAHMEQRPADDLVSPAFYTSRYGYKMCLALDLLGDGTGRGTHISIYLCLMKGEYDDILSWPFQQKVTFYLMDQRESRVKMHKSRELLPGNNWPEFGKPQAEKSVGRGFHRFIAHEIIESLEHCYLVNDCIYIKAIIDDIGTVSIL